MQSANEELSGTETLDGNRRVTPVVFIHSSFRTSSTWLWAEFRRQPQVSAYCEIFHEALADLRTGDVEAITYRSWRSGHPPTPPYFLEFLPLLQSEGGGIEGYDRAMAYDRFIPADGLGGVIGNDEETYVTCLIDLAIRRGRRPVLTDTRTLGRLVSLRRRFPGFHIFLYRNLFHQWLSYCSQADIGNPFFLNALVSTLQKNGHDPFIQFLAEAYLDDGPGDTTGSDEHDGGIQVGGSDSSKTRAPNEKMFIAFCGLHLYVSMNAAMYADLVLDANRLARDRAYQRQVQEVIEVNTGIAVDLSGATESLEHAEFRVDDLLALKLRLEAVLSKALLFLDVGAQNDRALRFGRTMLDETVEEISRHSLYTHAMRKHLNTCRSNAAEALARCDRLNGQLADLITLQDDLARVRSDLDAAIAETRRLQDRLDTCTGERDRFRRKIDTLRASTSWRVSAPVRWAGKVFRRKAQASARG